MSENSSVLVRVPTEKFGQAIIETKEYLGQVAFTVKVDSLLDICSFVKSDTDLNMDFLTEFLQNEFFTGIQEFIFGYLDQGSGLGASLSAHVRCFQLSRGVGGGRAERDLPIGSRGARSVAHPSRWKWGRDALA